VIECHLHACESTHMQYVTHMSLLASQLELEQEQASKSTDIETYVQLQLALNSPLINIQLSK
jgi:hypothetical protein